MGNSWLCLCSCQTLLVRERLANVAPPPPDHNPGMSHFLFAIFMTLSLSEDETRAICHDQVVFTPMCRDNIAVNLDSNDQLVQQKDMNVSSHHKPPFEETGLSHYEIA